MWKPRLIPILKLILGDYFLSAVENKVQKNLEFEFFYMKLGALLCRQNSANSKNRQKREIAPDGSGSEKRWERNSNTSGSSGRG